MQFSEFAKILRPVIGGVMGTGDFVQTLFSNIVTGDGDTIVDETANSTYRAYFNGTNRITKMALKIGPYLETENFVSYLSTFSDETVESLQSLFRPYIPEINTNNAEKLIAVFFRDIIFEAAGNLKGSPKKKVEISGGTNSTHSIPGEKIPASDQVVTEVFGDAIRHTEDDSARDTTEDAEVKDAEETSGAATDGIGDTRIQIINNPTVVNQYGDKNIHIDHVDNLKI